MMKLGDQALSKYKRSRIPSHFEYYKILRNYTTHAIEREKKAFLEYSLRNKNISVK